MGSIPAPRETICVRAGGAHTRHCPAVRRHQAYTSEEPKRACTSGSVWFRHGVLGPEQARPHRAAGATWGGGDSAGATQVQQPRQVTARHPVASPAALRRQIMGAYRCLGLGTSRPLSPTWLLLQAHQHPQHLAASPRWQAARMRLWRPSSVSALSYWGLPPFQPQGQK